MTKYRVGMNPLPWVLTPAGFDLSVPVLNGAFVDGHAATISQQTWERVDQDAQGFFYRISAADR